MANTFSWNTGDGDWAVASNWTDLTSGTAGPPTGADFAGFFGTGGTVTGTGTTGVLGIFGSGLWTLSAGNISAANIVEIGGALAVNDTLVTPFLNEQPGATDIQVLPTGHLTVTGTLTSPTNGFLNGVNIANTATVTGGTLDLSGGQLNIGTANQAASVLVQSGGTVNAWATILGGTPGQPASLLLTGAGTKWTDVGGAGSGSSNTGGYFLLGEGFPNGFGTNATLTVTSGALLSEAASAQIGTQQGGSGTATISAGGTWQVGSILSVGAGGTGALSITSGGTVVTLGNGPGGTFNAIANNPGNQGSVTVTGAGSRLSFAGIVTDGNGGNGTLSVLSGGSVVSSGTVFNNGTAGGGFDTVGNNNGATGTLLVDAAHWTSGAGLTIGNVGNGTLTVQNAGTVLTLGALGGTFNTIGNVAGGKGTVIVTGAGSLLSYAGTVSDGNGGTGVMSVLNGGSVATTDQIVINGTAVIAQDTVGGAFGANGSLLVDAATWSSGGGLGIGNLGTGNVTVQNKGLLSVATGFTVGGFNGPSLTSTGVGSLTIQSGGTVAVPGPSISNIAGGLGSRGTLTVTGTGSLLNLTGAITDGNAGTGTIAVLNGGSVVTSGKFVNNGTTSTVSDSIGSFAGAKGSLLVDAASWVSGGGLNIGNQGSGTLTVQNSGSLVSNGTFDNVGGQFGGFGIATVDGTHSSGNAAGWTETGNLTIGGQGAGTVTVQNGGLLTIGKGLTMGSGGTLASTGNGALNILSGSTVTIQGGSNSSFQNIGGGVGSVGKLTVSGTSSLLSSAGALIVGASGFGFASVTAGGSVVTGGLFVNNGTTQVASDSVGNAAGSDGTLAVNGGNWTAGGGFGIGQQSGSFGSVTLNTGTISVTANSLIGNSGVGSLTIGSGGTFVSKGTFNAVGNNAGALGSLIINAGGVWKSSLAPQTTSIVMSIGNNGGTNSLPAATGNVLVTGVGALLDTNGNPLSVANIGNGSLTVAQGGSVVAGTPDTNLFYGVAIGNRGGTGLLTITDPGSTLTSNGFFIDGRGGSGSLLIKNSGTLIVNDAPANGGGIGIGAGRGAGPTGSPPAIGGNGVATVTGGGVLDVNSTASGVTVGAAGVNGILNVNSNGTVLAGASLTVGSATSAGGTIYGGTGELNIGAAGVVRTQNATKTTYSVLIGNANASIGTAIAGTATGAASGQAIVSGTGALLDANGGGLAIGWLSTGALTVSKGGSAVSGTPDSTMFSALSIGRRAAGSVTITDAGSTVTANGVTYVGRAGAGSLLIENQGTLIGALDGKGAGGINIGGSGIGASDGVTYLMTGGSGSALVTSGGNMLSQQAIQVGTNGTNGDLTVNGGGTVTAATTFVIGDSVFVPTGDTVITPSGSFVSSGTLIGTAGVVSVGPGGVLTAGGTGVAAGTPVLDIGVGAASNGALNVAGPGAAATANGLLVIGDAGTGALTIQNGATVTAQGANIGASTAGSGVVNISDTASRFDIIGDLNLGTTGTGVLVMGVGTTLSVSGSIHIGTLGALDQFGGTIDPTDFTNDGTVVGGNGASIEVSGTLTNNGTYSATSGALSLNVGTIDGAGTLAVGGNSELQVNGSVGSGQTVQFGSTGTTTGVLTVGDINSFNPGVINGFSSGDAIVIASTSTLTQSFNDGTLTLTNDTGTAFPLVFGGTHTADDFTTAVVTATVNDGSIGAPNPLVGDFINNGTIFAENGTLDVQGSITGIGTLAVKTQGILQLDNVIGSGQMVQFTDGLGDLVIGNIASFAATIGSFNVGDEITVAGSAIASDSFDTTNHILTLFDASHATIGTLAFAPSVTGINFASNGTTVIGAAPVLTGGGNSVIYPGAAATAVALDPGLTIIDAASTLLASGTVAITGGFFANDGDVLDANTTGTAITLSYDSGAEILRLSGTDTLIDYQTVLNSVTFRSTALDPTGGGAHASRTISWSVNDGLATSNVVTNSVDVHPCFVAGTRIRTARGEVPVEELCEGDRLAVMLGRGEQAVIWIGHRAVDCARHPRPEKVWPVRVSAGAFGPAMPCRDLWLSPDHAVFVDGVLIPVKHLINGRTIVQVPVDTVTYYHVELPHHDVVLAEGLPAESYLDTGDRRNFANGGGAVVALHPDFSSRVWEADGCAPLVMTGPLLERVRRRLDALVPQRVAKVRRRARR